MKDLVPSEMRDLAIAICKLADSKKIDNVELYRVSHLSNIADYFVMATVSNATLAKSLADFLEESLEKKGIRPLRRDGATEWIVLDYDFVIVHIFTPEVQTFYRFDKLWNDGKNVYSMQVIDKLLEKEQKNEQIKAEKEKKAEKQKQEKADKLSKQAQSKESKTKEKAKSVKAEKKNKKA